MMDYFTWVAFSIWLVWKHPKEAEMFVEALQLQPKDQWDEY